jgi:Sec-independent protein translocase protein TatA
VFGIGLTEMILIGIVILMLFSPRELPSMIKAIAKVYGSIRRTAEEFRSQVMEAEELREPIEEIRAAYHGTKDELMNAQELARRELQRARAETMRAQQKLTEIVREESRRKDPLPAPAPAPAVAAAPATPAAVTPPATSSPSRPPPEGAVASSRPFAPTTPADDEPIAAPANDRPDAA